MELVKVISNDNDFNNIRNKIYKNGILSNYEKDGRMIFYTSKSDRFNPNLSELKQISNGYIYDVINKKHLVVPPRSYINNINTSIVNSYLMNEYYDILYIKEGTVINLYYWKNEWVISTTRSCDITYKIWGTKTYRQILSDILKDSENEFYSKLNKNFCYTFGIRHDDIHKFKEGKNDHSNEIWFIQQTDLSTLEVQYDTDLNISKQESFEIKENIKEVFPTLASALKEFNTSGKVFYGIQLRSKDPSKTGAYSNIVLESSLLQKIRQLIYHSSYNNITKLKNYDRNLFIIIYSYLDFNRSELFINLFPQYKPIYEKLEEITKDLANNILSFNDSNYKFNNACNKIIYKYSMILNDVINKNISIKYAGKHTNELISTFIRNTNWIDIYYKIYEKMNL